MSKKTAAARICNYRIKVFNMRELSLNILDIVTNSIEAQSSRVIICIEELQRDNIFRIRIRDNGRGMSREIQKKVLDPFVTSRTTRPVGMGLSLLSQAARQAGGTVAIQSALGKGTTVTAEFKKNHLNRSPMGNIADTIVNLIIGNLDIHFYYIHRTDFGRLGFDSYWIFARMAEQDCSVYEIVGPAKEHIQKKLSAIHSTG